MGGADAMVVLAVRDSAGAVRYLTLSGADVRRIAAALTPGGVVDVETDARPTLDSMQHLAVTSVTATRLGPSWGERLRRALAAARVAVDHVKLEIAGWRARRWMREEEP